MIVFELSCAEGHRFEGWFASAEDYARQDDSGLVACPLCGTSSVQRLPSARVRTTEASGPAARPAPAKPATEAPKEVTLASFIEQILANTEDVGRRFPEEARKIHYEEAPRRGIRGVATSDEARELADEGIPVVSLPIPPRGETH
jgi:hypothetical protein